MEGRAINRKIVVLTNAIGGKLVDGGSRTDQSIIMFDQAQDKYVHISKSSSHAAYRHFQSSPSRVWLVAHSLGRYPSINIMDADGNEYEANIRHLDQNNTLLTFSEPFSGYADAN